MKPEQKTSVLNPLGVGGIQCSCLIIHAIGQSALELVTQSIKIIKIV